MATILYYYHCVAAIFDYRELSGFEVSFEAGVPSQTVCVPVELVDDSIDEDEEFFVVGIDSVSDGSTIGSPNLTTVVVMDANGEN